MVSVAKFERSHFFSWPYGKSKEDYEKSGVRSDSPKKDNPGRFRESFPTGAVEVVAVQIGI